MSETKDFWAVVIMLQCTFAYERTLSAQAIQSPSGTRAQGLLGSLNSPACEARVAVNREWSNCISRHEITFALAAAECGKGTRLTGLYLLAVVSHSALSPTRFSGKPVLLTSDFL